jgi:hypothetical protein
VLGPNFEAFTLSGIWDDRYAGEGFADKQRIEFEKLVQRGNFCRFTFQKVTFTGIITHFKATYRRGYYVPYEFTVSPHYRVSAGDSRKASQLVPKATSAPDSLLKVQTKLQEVNQLQTSASAAGAAQDGLPESTQLQSSFFNQASALQSAIGNLTAGINNTSSVAAFAPLVPGVLYSTFGGLIDALQTAADTLGTILDTRGAVPAADASGTSTLAKISSGFSSIAQQAAAALPQFATLSTASNLSFEGGVVNLSFEFWQRGLAARFRQLVVIATAAAKDAAALDQGNALALYRPRHGESLYGISNRFYSTPHHWRDVFDANHLVGITMTGSELLIIPDRRSA